MKYLICLFIFLFNYNIFAQVELKILNIKEFDTYIDIEFYIKNNSNSIRTINEPLPNGKFLGETLIRLFLVNDNKINEIQPFFGVISDINPMYNLEPKEKLMKHIILQKFHLLRLFNRYGIPADKKIRLQLSLSEYDGNDSNKFLTNLKSNQFDASFDLQKDTEVYTWLKTRPEDFLLNLYNIPDFNITNIGNISDVDLKLLIEKFPNSSYADWARYIIAFSKAVSSIDSIKRRGIFEIKSLNEITKDKSLKRSSEQGLIYLQKMIDESEIIYNLEDTPYYNDVIEIIKSDSFEKELVFDTSKYLTMAKYILKKMPNSYISYWANYILELNNYLSKSESRSREGRKALKRLKQITKDEELKKRIGKWIPISSK